MLHAVLITIVLILFTGTVACRRGQLEDPNGWLQGSGLIGEWRFDGSSGDPMIVVSADGSVRFMGEIYLSPLDEETGGRHVKNHSSYLRMTGPRRAESLRTLGRPESVVTFEITDDGLMVVSFGSEQIAPMMRINPKD